MHKRGLDKGCIIICKMNTQESDQRRTQDAELQLGFNFEAAEARLLEAKERLAVAPHAVSHVVRSVRVVLAQRTLDQLLEEGEGYDIGRMH